MSALVLSVALLALQAPDPTPYDPNTTAMASLNPLPGHSMAEALARDTQGRQIRYKHSIGKPYLERLLHMDDKLLDQHEKERQAATLIRHEQEERDLQFFWKVRDPP